MKWITDQDLPLQEPTAAALGTFDGMHLGHLAILNRLKQKKEKSMVYTFENVPAQYFSGKRELLFLPQEKKQMLANLGIDFLYMRPFGEKIASMLPEEFLSFLVHQLGVRQIVAGFNYSFGRNGKGTSAFLLEYGKKWGIHVEIVPPVQMDGICISSTAIRQCLDQGDVAKAAKLLGRMYAMDGIIQKGRQLGRTIDFPTINFAPHPEKKLPKNGVYAAYVQLNGAQYPAITNIGTRPTVQGKGILIESHLMGYTEDCYGKHATVLLKEWLREERPFASLDALKDQLRKDEKRALAFLK